jgi:predicted Zn-dependent protease
MAKKIKKSILKRRKNLSDEVYEKLQEISDLIDQGDFDSAYDLLAPLERKYPVNDEIWEERTHFYTSLGDISEAWWSAYRTLQLNRDNMQVLTSIVYLSTELQMTWAIQYYIELYRENSVFLPPQFTRLNESLDELAQEIHQTNPETKGRKLADLALIDISRQLMVHSQLDEAIKVCRRAIKIFPDSQHVNQTMSILLMSLGELQKAIDHVQKAIVQFPEDSTFPHLLSQFYYLKGDIEAAEKVYQDLLSSPPSNIAEYPQRIQLLAALDKADDILSIYQTYLVDNPDQELPLEISHYVATAMALTGDTKNAKNIWKETQDSAPSIASENLQDLDLPPSRQNGVAYFDIGFIIPSPWIELLSQPTKSDAQIKRRIDKLFKSAPWFENLIHILLQRGDAESRRFAFFICTYHPVPLLHEFVTGTKGSDVQRLTALAILIKQDMVSVDDLPEIMMDGKSLVPDLFKYKITYEPIYEELSKYDQRMIRKCHELLVEEYWGEALDLIFDTLELLPDNRVLFNYRVMALMGMGDKVAADEVLEEMVEKFPDYHFTRMDKARRLIQEKQYDEAQQWIKLVEAQTEFHFSELKVYAIAKIEWFIAHKENDTARNWLHQLEAVFPELVDDLQMYHKKLENPFASIPLLNRFL